MRNKILFSGIVVMLLSACHQDKPAFRGWEVYGGDNSKLHYSSLTQIDTGNVKKLKVAWIYHTNDAGTSSQIQVNPIIINNILYGVSPKLKLFAVDAGSGKEKWTFDPLASNPNEGDKAGGQGMNACRGVTYYSSSKQDGRIFYTAGSLLYCINTDDGKPVTAFGSNGSIDLHDGLGRDVKDLYVTSTTPGTIYKDLIIVGTRVAEEAGAAPGHIRAYDVHTGNIRWTFHTIPYPGEPGYDSWEDTSSYQHAGGANAWAGFSLDEIKGIVFAQTGSASYDFYGGNRKGNNLYANCVLAINAETGKYIWHYQTVHHDVWDRDPPTPPVLVDVWKDGKKIEAVVQLTKTGFIFMLHRATGKPVYPIVETPVPSQSELEGEQLSSTQPIPGFFQPFARQSFTGADLNTHVPDSSYQDIKRRFASYKTGNIYTPPSKAGTIMLPGTDGGAEWGGPSFDPESGLMYINSNDLAWVLTMIAIDKKDTSRQETNWQTGNRLYRSNCMGCHGPNREGAGNNPSLIDVEKKHNEASFTRLITSGVRMMPAFKQFSTSERTAIAAYVLDLKKTKNLPYTGNAKGDDLYTKMPYLATGYHKFLTKEGYPAISPPWGTLTAVNLNTGEVMWKNTLGDYPELKAKGIHAGTENYGGSVVTAGGLLFIAATKDAKFRAYHKRTGELLWETDLPVPGFATPSVYEVNGKQYIVIACGGGKLKAPSGDAYIAFALPEKSQ